MFSPIRSRNNHLLKDVQSCLHISMYNTHVPISSTKWATGGSAGQPLQVLDGRALNQPKPHPSDVV